MGTVLASDISGSSLTIAFQNSEQDAAMRKFLVSSTSRGDAITTVTTALTATGFGANHPNESNLKANQITAQSVGPSRWLVSVRYIRLKIGGLPSGADETLGSLRMSSEATQVYCTPSQFQNGLPFGGSGTEFVSPGPYGSPTDPDNKPQPWVYNRPVVNIQVPFSSNTNPVSNKIDDVSKVNAIAMTLVGIGFAIGDVRYDGAELRSVLPGGSGIGGIRYFGTESYTAAYGGWFKQVLKWVDDAWVAQNISLYDTV